MWTRSQRYCTGCALAVLFGFLALALYISPFTPSQPLSDGRNYATARTAQPGTDQQAATGRHSSRGKIPLTNTDSLLATYTGLLAGFTGVLALVSIVQGWFLFRADKTARISAEAAKASADALQVTERAYVYPVIVSFGDLMDHIRLAKAFFLDTDNSKADAHCSESVGLAFKIKNYGKTPAILKQVFAAFGVYPLGAGLGVVVPEGILGAGEATSELTSEMQQGLSRNEANHVVVYTRHIAFVGEIVFEDIWANEYRTRFHFAWEHSTNKMQLAGLVTEQTKATALP